MIFSMLIAMPGYSQQNDPVASARLAESQLEARVGIAIHTVGTGQRWQYRSNERFPMSSTFKTLACAALLQRVDSGSERLDRLIGITEDDYVTYSPVTETRNSMTLAELCEATITLSDNTAGNLVLQAVGGPQGLTRFMRSIGDEITRLDRWETDLNEVVPGDVRDTTSPAAMADTLEKLLFSDVLSASSRAQLESWLQHNAVGDALLRRGIPADWVIGDKTGAGGFGSRSIAAVVRPPFGQPMIVTVYITETTASRQESDAAIAQIGRELAAALQGLQE